MAERSRSGRLFAPVVLPLLVAALLPRGAQGQEADAPAVAEEAAPAPGVDLGPAAARPDAARFGASLRTRWVSVPGWFLDLFTKANQPVSSYGVGVEVFRRKENFELALGFGYQRMAPPDGNWLGKGENASEETDFVQAPGLGIAGVDVSFIYRTPIARWVDFHAGAGLGFALVTGKVLRTSASRACTDQNVEDTRACRPIICPPTGCTKEILEKSEGELDNGPDDPHRFEEDDVPGAVPILNLLTGFTFRAPQLPGFEARVEGGFYDAFFLGTALGYLF
jgi:hypothetical protein